MEDPKMNLTEHAQTTRTDVGLHGLLISRQVRYPHMDNGDADWTYLSNSTGIFHCSFVPAALRIPVCLPHLKHLTKYQAGIVRQSREILAPVIAR